MTINQTIESYVIGAIVLDFHDQTNCCSLSGDGQDNDDNYEYEYMQYCTQFQISIFTLLSVGHFICKRNVMNYELWAASMLTDEHKHDRN